jgi:hypothetical protein
MLFAVVTETARQATVKYLASARITCRLLSLPTKVIMEGSSVTLVIMHALRFDQSNDEHSPVSSVKTESNKVMLK